MIRRESSNVSYSRITPPPPITTEQPTNQSPPRSCCGCWTIFWSVIALGLIVVLAIFIPKIIGYYPHGLPYIRDVCTSSCTDDCFIQNNNITQYTAEPLPLPDLQNPSSSPWYITTSISSQPLSIDDDALKVKYKSGKWGSDSGAEFRANPRQTLPSDSATLSYSVYFPSDFPWNRGGKLPGLCIGDSPTSCASGGKWSASSGSVRVMWRGEGHAIGYLYIPLQVGSYKDQPTDYRQIAQSQGDSGVDLWCDVEGGLQLNAGQWNNITMTVILSTPGMDDGYFALTVNNDTRVVKNMRWRSDANVKITSMFFSTFFGGGNSKWAVPHDTYGLFKDFGFTAPVVAATTVA